MQHRTAVATLGDYHEPVHDPANQQANVIAEHRLGGCGPIGTCAIAADSGVAVTAATERIALPIVNVMREQLRAQVLRRNAKHPPH